VFYLYPQIEQRQLGLSHFQSSIPNGCLGVVQLCLPRNGQSSFVLILKGSKS